MKNPFLYSNDNKRYHTWNYYLRQKYGQKICKIPLSGGFTCPNRDGSKATGGCSFCSGKGSGEFAGNTSDSIAKQLGNGKQIMRKKWPNAKFLAYFQPFSGTYAPVERLYKLYDSALNDVDVVGLCIATRPDCLPNNVCQVLSEFNQRTDLYVELGLQTVHDKTAMRLNRCHSYADFLSGYAKLQQLGIRVCVHIIDGLPWETPEMMLQTAKEVAKLHPFGVKIHLLHILKDTPLAKWYRNGLFELTDRSVLIKIICDQLECLPKQIVLERLTGDADSSELIAPSWSKKKFTILNDVDKELARRNSWQGRLCSNK